MDGGFPFHFSTTFMTHAATSRTATGIALFDLDYTLLGGDATWEWIHFLVREGAIDRESYIAELHRFYDEYDKGTLDIVEFLHFDFGALAKHKRAKLEALRRRYLDTVIAPLVPPKSVELVRSHKDHGHLTAIITAANGFISTPMAAMFGVDHIVASDPECIDGEFTGRIDGIACYHEGKITKLTDWLASRGQRLGEFAESWYYGDSPSDVPLMEQVANPVAVGPNEKLATIARERGWPIISLR